VLATLMVVSNVVASISCLKYDAAIPAVDKRFVESTYQLSSLAPFFVSPVLISILFFVVNHVDALEGLTETLPVMPLLVVSLFQAVVGSSLAFATRQGAFKRFALIRLVQPIVFVAAALLTSVGLIDAFAFGWAASAVLSLYLCRNGLTQIRPAQMYLSAKKSIKFPIYTLPGTLVQTSAVALPTLFLVWQFGESIAGSYSQIQRISIAPLFLLALATSQVFYKHAGDLNRGGSSIVELIIKLVGTMSLLSFALLAIAFMFGVELVTLVLGPAWEVDELFVFLAVAVGLPRIIGSPVSTSLLLLGKQNVLSLWQIGYFAAITVLLFYSQSADSVVELLEKLTLVEITLYFTLITLCIVLARNGYQNSKGTSGPDEHR
jgi:O-antigen/teichoic acid export membrane protein